MDFSEDPRPLARDVEQAFFSQITDADKAAARAWLTDAGIEPAPVISAAGTAALIQCARRWDEHQEREAFVIEQAGDSACYLAAPLIESGEFVDLLLIDCATHDVSTACGRAHWAGRDNLRNSVLRLHAHPLDWLAGGCKGACHIALTTRQSLKDLTTAERIQCDDVHTALDAWEWGFDGEPSARARFEIDAPPDELRAFIHEAARHKARMLLAEERRAA